MATRRYMTNRGETDSGVTEAAGAAVVTKNMEFTVDLAASESREDVLLGLDRIKRYILTNKWPPA